ncbi:MAG TPA: phage head closure protein [Terriglobia bacterium]|nr:phage head closure protein [Terriglobia bacterium]
MIQAGKLRNLVTIEQKAGSQDASGQVIYAWTTYVKAWVSIEQLSGLEREAAQSIFAGANCRMRMRYQPGVLPAMRVTLPSQTNPNAGQDRHFDIVAALDPDGRQRELQIMCVERVESGQVGE